MSYFVLFQRESLASSEHLEPHTARSSRAKENIVLLKKGFCLILNQKDFSQSRKYDNRNGERFFLISNELAHLLLIELCLPMR